MSSSPHKRSVGLVRTGAFQWDFIRDGRRVQTITDEQCARIIQAAIGVPCDVPVTLRRQSDSAQWTLGREIWKAADGTEMPAACRSEEMASALMAIGFEEVRS